MWDSTENRPTVLKYKDFFDDIFSFDPKSCFEHNLKFLPLFFFKRSKKKKIKSNRKKRIQLQTFLNRANHSFRHENIKYFALEKDRDSFAKECRE